MVSRKRSHFICYLVVRDLSCDDSLCFDMDRNEKKGLVNPSCTGLIGSGLVVHLPSLFDEIDALESQGTDTQHML